MTIAVIFMWNAEFPDRDFAIIVKTIVTDSIILLAMYGCMFLFVSFYTYFTFYHNGVQPVPVQQRMVPGVGQPAVPGAFQQVAVPGSGQLAAPMQQSQNRLGGNLIEAKSFCGFCGKQNEGQNQFCRFCGKPLGK